MITAPLGEILPFDPEVAVMVNVFCTNAAVIVLFPFITTDRGLLEPLASPLHDENAYPDDGVAVNWTVVPLSTTV